MSSKHIYRHKSLVENQYGRRRNNSSILREQPENNLNWMKLEVLPSNARIARSQGKRFETP